MRPIVHVEDDALYVNFYLWLMSVTCGFVRKELKYNGMMIMLRLKVWSLHHNGLIIGTHTHRHNVRKVDTKPTDATLTEL